jgi:alkanesulfonate monooxygenase SsuD/methylene tetrahydromethanopterin reductase-like flavin-dependent oxidoreductase (luciferase family)
MHVGILQIFQNFENQVTDAELWDQEVAIALEAEKLGFDSIWSVEHHFNDYSACPDNMQYLSYLAARTERIQLATGAVILPWNQPIRVAEKMSMLDQLSGGRAIFGMGRGLARREYGGMGIDMDTSRDRFDEAAEMILKALDDGFIEGEGPHYQQEKTDIRPKPGAGFRDRLYAIAMSPDSVDAAAKLGAGMAIFSQQPWESACKEIARYREQFAEQHPDKVIPPIMTSDMVLVDEDEGRAREMAEKYVAGYLYTVVNHYELMSDHFKKAKGYEMYGSTVDLFRDIGLEPMAQEYIKVQAWGTPDQVLEKLAERSDRIGDYSLNCCFRFAGIPYDYAQQSMQLFADKVLPKLH